MYNMWITDKMPVDGSQDMRPMAFIGLRQLLSYCLTAAFVA